MTADQQRALAAAMDLIEATAAEIRALEAEARQRIEAGDADGYRDRYEAKIRLLLDLPHVVAALLPAMAAPIAARLAEGTGDFARRAGQAQALDSLFYMYALLYPDDYREGQPNDLERFAAEMRDLAG